MSDDFERGDGDGLGMMGFGEGSRFAAHLDRGWSLLERGETALARTAAEHASELEPDAADPHMLLGAIAAAAQDSKTAVRAYEKAIELDPDYVEPYASIAQLLAFELQAPERALALCEDALELDLAPVEHLDLSLLAAECAFLAGRDADARGRLDQLEHTELLQRALLETDDEEATEAMTDLFSEAESVDLDDEPEVARLAGLGARLGRILLDLGAPREAAVWLDAAVHRSPRDADAWYLLSESLHASAEPRRSVQAALQVYGLDAEAPLPDWTPSHDTLNDLVSRLLRGLPTGAFGGLVDPGTALAVLVHESPSLEMIVEGLDPRLPVVALATRGPVAPSGAPGTAADTTPVLTGLAIYRRNLVRMIRRAEDLEAELRLALLEELAALLRLDDRARNELGLMPLRAPEDPDADDDGRRRKRGRLVS